MKKTLLALLGALLAQPVIAQDLEDEARDFTYEYEGQTLTYTVLDEDAKTCETKGGSIFSGGNYVSGNLIIPATAKDGDMEYSVTSIGMFAFSECSGLTTVTIPESVTSIGDYAFYWCSDLTSVEISNSVSSIGNNAFYQCSNLTSVSIGNSVSSIGVAAFYQCSNLTSVTIPGSVSSIANTAFENCSGLTSFKVEEGESVISFGDNALASCPVEDLYLGRNWTYSGSGAISTGIKTLTLGEKVTALPDNAFADCTSLTSVVIPYSVKSIGSGAFAGCSGLTSFKVEDGESSISFGENALASCPVENLYLGRNWTYSGSGAISTGIKTLTLGEKVTALPDNAFADCTSLTSVVIPYSVKSIGSGAFAGCSGLTSFKVEDGESSISFGENALASCPVENLYLGRNWTYSGSGAISTGIKTLTLGEKVTALPDNAFADCTSLTSVVIPYSVKSIGNWAFFSCSGLTSVVIPNSVTIIGNSAFYSCYRLTSLVIPNSVRSIGTYAFFYCYGLTSVEIPNSVTSIGSSAFSYCYNLTSVEIPNSMTSIGDSVFRYCTRLTSVIIPNSVTNIDIYAFADCNALTSVEIPGSVTSIGNQAFGGSTNVSTVHFQYSSNPIKINKGAFKALKNIVWERDMEGFNLNVSNLETLTVGNTVAEVPAGVCKDATYLTSLTLGNSLTAIGDEAFAGCTALKKVILPPSVETIGAFAFNGNTNLASIIMGHRVTTVGEMAFDLCPAQTVSITAQTPPTATDNTFSNYTGTLYVQGETASDSYSDANESCWSKFNVNVMTVPSEIKTTGTLSPIGEAGDTFQLTATLYPGDVTLPQVFWRSTNPAVATVDHNGLVTIHADLSEIMAMAEGNEEETATQSCKIIAESLYANDPTAEFTIKEDITTGEEEISADVIDSSLPVQVYTLQGMMVGDCVENLSAGIYIVRQGKNVKKIAVK